MELVRPWSGIMGNLYRTYLFRVVPVLGRWLSGDNKAYRYLPDSVGSFITTDELQAIMENIGFRQVSYKRLNLGTIGIHIGVK
jgi:demethylmenaquinone methyltransferase/2-methoxy-6-polyprenyl-1,4-benzoquinol methylase